MSEAKTMLGTETTDIWVILETRAVRKGQR
jgi:hypothetical protein